MFTHLLHEIGEIGLIELVPMHLHRRPATRPEPPEVLRGALSFCPLILRLMEEIRGSPVEIGTWMSRWKLGSMVSKWVITYL